MPTRVADKRIPLEQVRFPEILRVREYLEQRKGNRSLPARSDIRPEDLSFALGQISILEVVSGSPPDFVYRLYGTSISAMDQDEMTGRSVRDAKPAEYCEIVVRHYQEALEAGCPVFHEVEVEAGRLRAVFQRGLFPLSDDGATINKLFSVSAWGPEFGRCWQHYLDETMPRASEARENHEAAGSHARRKRG